MPGFINRNTKCGIENPPTTENDETTSSVAYTLEEDGVLGFYLCVQIINLVPKENDPND